jgi:hypothetical protein
MGQEEEERINQQVNKCDPRTSSCNHIESGLQLNLYALGQAKWYENGLCKLLPIVVLGRSLVQQLLNWALMSM